MDYPTHVACAILQAMAQADRRRRREQYLASLSHRRKLARAEAHIKDLEALMTAWRSNGYRTFKKPNSEGRFVLYAEQLEPLPDPVDLVLGDALQCLRNSLDHIVFALSKEETPGMTAEEEGETAFPIYDKGVKPASRAIACLSSAARKDVRRLAPDPGRGELSEHPLCLLHKMSNRDKHRSIAVLATAIGPTDLRVNSASYLEIFGPQKLGAAPVALMEFARTNLDAQVTGSVEIVFDKGVEVADRPVGSTLLWFHDHIRDTVFQCLEKHFRP